MHTSTFLKLVTITSLLSTVAACTKDDALDPIKSADRTATFRAELAQPLTMAPIESDDVGLVTSGDVTGIQILRGTNGVSPAFNALSAPTTTATLNGTGVLTPAVEMKLNTDGSAVHFMAYYPEATTFTPDASDKLKIGWTIDGAQDIIASAPVTKSFTAGGDNIVALHFEHLLARIELKVTAYDQANLDFYQGIEEAYVVIPNKIELQVAADGSSQSYCTSQPAKDEDWTTASFGNVALTLSENTSSSYVMLWPDAGRIRNGELCIRFKGLPNEVQHYSISDLKLEAGKTSRVYVTVGSSIEPARTAYYGTANCYEVHAAGSYSFDITPYTTTVGTYPYQNKINQGLPTPRSAAMLWSDVSSTHVTNVSVARDATHDTYSLTFTTDGSAGNAVIAIYNTTDPTASNAKILWSYHIWVSDRTDASNQLWGVVNTTNNTHVVDRYEMMGRNLGATSNNIPSAENGYDNSSYGLHYQWGRKDPFVGSATYNTTVQKTIYSPAGVTSVSKVLTSAAVGTIAYSIQHPMAFIYQDNSQQDWLFAARNHALWGNPNPSTTTNFYPRPFGVKSIYDPCPEGYQVPPQDAFSGIVRSNSITVNGNGVVGSWDVEGGVTHIATYFGALFYCNADQEGEKAYLPCAGNRHYRGGDLEANAAGNSGFYWTNSPHTQNNTSATRGSFNKTTWNPIWSSNRGLGASVRCVKTK